MFDSVPVGRNNDDPAHSANIVRFLDAAHDHLLQERMTVINSKGTMYQGHGVLPSMSGIARITACSQAPKMLQSLVHCRIDIYLQIL